MRKPIYYIVRHDNDDDMMMMMMHSTDLNQIEDCGKRNSKQQHPHRNRVSDDWICLQWY